MVPGRRRWRWDSPIYLQHLRSRCRARSPRFTRSESRGFTASARAARRTGCPAAGNLDHSSGVAPLPQVTARRRWVSVSPNIATPLLDHPVRSRQHIRRNRQTDLFGGFEINDELKLRRLLDWKIGGLGTL